MKQIVVLGSVTADIFLQIPTTYTTHDSWTFPLGMKIPVDTRQELIGGGGANAARIIALHHDFRVHFPYCVGNDYWGEQIGTCLKNHGIQTYPLVVSEPTANSYILYGGTHDSVVFSHKGANKHSALNHSIKELCETSAGIFIAPINTTSTEKTKTLIGFLAAQTTIPRLCIVHPAWNDDVRTLVKQALHQSTMILSMNMAEAIAFWELPQDISFSQCADAIQTAMKNAQGICIVTGGSKGAYCITAAEIMHQESYASTIISTVGAGDAFAATFFSCTLLGIPLQDSLALAARQSALVMQDISTTGQAQDIHQLRQQYILSK